MNIEHVKRVGIAAAYAAGKILASRFGKLTEIKKKGAIDLVTDADIAAEGAIVEIIRAAFPDHAILAEESGDTAGASDARWIIDPLDGTTNYAHQLGLYAVSIAFSKGNSTRVGIVLCPPTNELFCAVRERGAERNGQPIRVSDTPTVSDSLLVTGFPYHIRSILPTAMERFSNCLAAARGIRRLGSAAMDLCYVACGRFDAFWEEGLRTWDTAAGELIAREAGGRVSDFRNRPYNAGAPEILVSNGPVHDEMINLLKIKGTE